MRTIIIGILPLLCLIACKKKESVTPEEVPPPVVSPVSQAYEKSIPLKIGNYWIYKYFHMDENNVIINEAGLDSVYVQKDTVIRGRTFYKMVGMMSYGLAGTYLSDSLHYLIDGANTIIASSSDYQNVLNKGVLNDTDGDTIAFYERRMFSPDSVVKVPAGSFKTSTALRTYSIMPNFQSSGNKDKKYEIKLFAKNVGCIYESHQYLSLDMTFGRRLVRYHLN